MSHLYFPYQEATSSDKSRFRRSLPSYRSISIRTILDALSHGKVPLIAGAHDVMVRNSVRARWIWTPHDSLQGSGSWTVLPWFLMTSRKSTLYDESSENTSRLSHYCRLSSAMSQGPMQKFTLVTAGWLAAVGLICNL